MIFTFSTFLVWGIFLFWPCFCTVECVFFFLFSVWGGGVRTECKKIIWAVENDTFISFLIVLKCFTLIKNSNCSISELFNKNRSRNTNERLKWYTHSLKLTKFPEIRNISWMKDVIPSNLFKIYKTHERY